MSTPAPQKQSLARSAGITSLGTAFSRVSGLLREQVMAYFFGAGMATDAFVTAFRIPNLLRDLFAEGALSSAFVPVFKEKLVREDKEEAFHLANTANTALLLVLGIITLIGIAATPAIIYLTAYGFTDDAVKFNLTVNLTRIMWLFLPMVSVSALVMGMLNSFERFGVPALAPSMFNVGNIAAVLLLYRFFDAPIYTLAIGVLVGGLGQIVVQLPPLWRLGYRFQFRFDFFSAAMKKMFKLFTPMVIGLSAGRINILLSTLLVSFLAEGSMSYLNYAFRLMHFPLGVFGVALGTVTLPRASELASRGEMGKLGKVFRESLNLSFLLIIPSAFAVAILGREIVSLIYEYGRFSEGDAANTSLALLHYAYGLVGFAAVRVTVPIFYALGDSKLPMKISIFSVVVNMALYYPLIKLMDFAGVAAATSLAALVNFALLLYFLPRKGVHVAFGEIFLALFRMTVAAGLAMTIAKLIPVLTLIPFEGIAGKLVVCLLPLAIGAILYIMFCALLGVHEVKTFGDAISRRFRR